MSDIKQQWIQHIENVLIENQGHRLTPVVINGLILQMAHSLPPFAADQPQPEQQNVSMSPAPDRLLPPVEASETYGEVFFVVAPLQRALDAGLRELHALHWQETESYRNHVEMNPDYERMQRFEAQGRFLLFAMLHQSDPGAIPELIGNCMIYVDRSTHDQTLVAQEDTIFVRKEWRGKGRATAFINFVHGTLKAQGVTEIRVTTKNGNHVGELLKRRHGYEEVGQLLVKRLDRPLYRPLEEVKTEAA